MTAAVVADEDDDRIIRQPLVIEALQNLSYILVHHLD